MGLLYELVKKNNHKRDQQSKDSQANSNAGYIKKPKAAALRNIEESSNNPNK
ncbi:hypothetical protein GCM10008018_53080 [Paenibacillus marchantiophytorum]|uniref:Uncharacterized protein n=1 Tax=Paenibacillus marchantiophytorum TaxID=1619310 RepID=A0ABQ1F6K2_9BACL|nr:hypothetical protein GCM10008018_53080 [Paenibacillus marchantiophytorum]